ncbi:hypothetical protein F5880DRAFT_1618258 [Lentinula raphanica]|nr:hypothetical protein F5880DRAFT_1618258 [Lentinula raphanica]
MPSAERHPARAKRLIRAYLKFHRWNHKRAERRRHVYHSLSLPGRCMKFRRRFRELTSSDSEFDSSTSSTESFLHSDDEQEQVARLAPLKPLPNLQQLHRLSSLDCDSDLSMSDSEMADDEGSDSDLDLEASDTASTLGSSTDDSDEEEDSRPYIRKNLSRPRLPGDTPKIPGSFKFLK